MPGYISEIDYYGGAANEWVEIAVPAGTDVSGYTLLIYDSDGYVEATLPLGAVQSTNGGHDVYLVDAGTAGWSGLDQGEGVALVDDTSTVLQFISYKGFTVTAEDGPAEGMTSVNAGSDAESEGKSLQSDDGGNTYYVQTAPNPGTIPCYGPGTLIATPMGPRAVETLGVGDLVLTADSGAQAIVWVQSGEVPLEAAEPEAKPVLISAGALGRNIPVRDMIVSPQHRILIGAAGQLSALWGAEAFAPAKALTGLPGVRHMGGKKKIIWHQFACARHEVVFANDCRSESLLLGPMVLQGLSRAMRAELYQVFGARGDRAGALNGPAARPCLKVREVREILARLPRSERLVA